MSFDPIVIFNIVWVANYRKYSNLVRTQVEVISDHNHFVRILFER